MFVASPKALASAGILAAVLASSPAAAQSNPFVRSPGASKAQIERIVDAKLSKIEAELQKLQKNAGGPNAPGAPNGVPIAGGATGAAVPGTMTSPGMPGPAGIPGGMPGQPGVVMGPNGSPIGMEAPKSAYETAEASGVRFLGCINGFPKFVHTTGRRVTFTEKEIRDAQKAGLVPVCR